MTVAEVNEKCYCQTTIDEHHLIVGEPSGFYLSHFAPKDGTGANIARSIYTAVKDTHLEQKLKIIGSDGRAVLCCYNR